MKEKELTSSEIKKEMLKIKIPYFIKITDKFWFKFGKYILTFGMLAYVPAGIIYQSIDMRYVDLMWSLMVGWFFFLFIGIGGTMLISHIIKNRFVKKHAKRLGISIWEWNLYAKELNLVSFKK